MKYTKISGFADEICPGFDEQLEALSRMGMDHICIRTADRKSIAAFTPEEAEENLLPRLRKAGVKVSSLGSPIGKTDIEKEEDYLLQLQQLENLCQICHLLDCRYIRVFSFYLPEDKDPASFRETVIERLRAFVAVAEKYDIILLHENEKGIYGDTGERCLDILRTIDSPYLKAAYDFANFVQCMEDPEACWEMLKPYVEYIHIKDALFSNKENVLCGTGDGKILPILTDAFRNLHYDGFLTLEPHLTIFTSLSSLEKGRSTDVALKDQYATGEEAYRAQYEALLGILEQI